MPRTKIVCTIGPSSDDERTMRALIDAGMSIVRVNFSHGTRVGHAATISKLRKVAAEVGTTLPILADLQGPKIRIGEIPGGEFETARGEQIVLTSRRPDPTASPVEIHLPHPDVLRDLDVGQRLLLDDGKIEFRVESKSGDELHCVVVDGGPLRSRKGVSAPGAPLSIAALTEKDRNDVRFAIEQDVDFIALSFVRTPEDVIELRELLDSSESSIPIIVKIEKPEALLQFDAILERADGVMIARGDLGVETPPEHVPFSQKRIIEDCRREGKPVITATQMLESMMESPRPTRAEASDVANAILDGTSAVMLSGETAAGEYPVESVKMMSRIADFAEQNIPYEERLYSNVRVHARHATEAVTDACVEMAHELGARAIFTSSFAGLSARLIARHRPRTPIVVATPNAAMQRQLVLLWGVHSVLVEYYETTDEMIALADRLVCELGLAQRGDRIIIAAGIPPGRKQTANMVNVHVVTG